MNMQQQRVTQTEAFSVALIPGEMTIKLMKHKYVYNQIEAILFNFNCWWGVDLTECFEPVAPMLKWPSANYQVCLVDIAPFKGRLLLCFCPWKVINLLEIHQFQL